MTKNVKCNLDRCIVLDFLDAPAWHYDYFYYCYYSTTTIFASKFELPWFLIDSPKLSSSIVVVVLSAWSSNTVTVCTHPHADRRRCCFLKRKSRPETSISQTPNRRRLPHLCVLRTQSYRSSSSAYLCQKKEGRIIQPFLSKWSITKSKRNFYQASREGSLSDIIIIINNSYTQTAWCVALNS